MIYHNPPNFVLGDAEVITFFDVNVPGWKEIVVRRQSGLPIGGSALSAISIPVDSTDPVLLTSWRERIAQARCNGR